MATRLLREGPDVADLIAQVRAEFGPDARIVRAERVRTGGFAGFFAKESFEITVDVPERPARRRPRPRPAAATLEQMLEAADAADLGFEAGDEPAAGVPTPRGATGVGGPGALAGEGLAPAAEGPDLGPEPGSTGFDAVLAQVQALADEVPDAEPTGPVDLFTPGLPATPVSGDAGASGLPGPRTPVDDLLTGAAGGVVAGGEPLRRGLRAIGVPAALVGEGDASLAAVVARIPAAPPAPRTPGAVHVLVGAPDDVLAVAHVLVERLGAGPSALVLAGRTASGPVRAGGRVLAAPSSATAWRGSATSRGHAWVVALGVGEEPGARAETTRMLRALRPDATWAVVDARRKPRDSVRWIEEVAAGDPRAFDAVAARGVFETGDPGTVLDLGLPIALMDGVPCSPVAWAAALGEALGPVLDGPPPS
ncbi:hypothetical protein [Cellulomonas marina]|uniref:Uncharacterized protein n=1 Tax=Cellulomonas marina TaxID=988821 RepID=A0A1I1ASL5_9CELL|nr:hypothetical protein [Cellulomonas marina]GIG30643.1 hypothetical protein Cma02nite_32430 [Cellulomonas marina]SFB39468.1 hypothetical protein SAMN05421867_12058 [Cellulomonas marina]